MNKIYIIGVGSGAPDYLLPIAKKKIEKADCLIGGRRNLQLFKDLDKEKIAIEGHFDEIIPYLKKNLRNKRIAILVSGDPGLYSFLKPISGAFKKEEFEVIPGISPIQVAFARIGESWENAHIISAHGRKIDNLAEKIKRHKTIALFTDRRLPPPKIASYLLKKGLKNRRVVSFENLSYSDERIVDTDLVNLSKMKGSPLCVMIIKREIK